MMFYVQKSTNNFPDSGKAQKEKKLCSATWQKIKYVTSNNMLHSCYMVYIIYASFKEQLHPGRVTLEIG